MKNRKRIIIGLAAAFVVIAVMVCLLPWPTRLPETYTVYAVSKDGQMTDPVTVSVDGWKLDYLFFNDKLKYTAQVPDGNALSDGLELQIFKWHDDRVDLYDMSSFELWTGETVEKVSCTFTADCAYFTAQIGDKFYAGSKDPNFTLEDAIEAFQQGTDINFDSIFGIE